MARQEFKVKNVTCNWYIVSAQIIISILILLSCIIMALLLVIQGWRSEQFNSHSNGGFLPQVLAAWMALHRTLLTYLLVFSIITVS